MKYLYCYKVSQGINGENAVKCNVFTPSILGGLLLPGETKSIKQIGVRLWFQIMTWGKAKIFFVTDGNNLIHTSYVVPKCSKFAFLGKDDYQIGSCVTYPQYRGKGIYPSVLRSICSSVGNDNTTFYMVVDETNISSIKGIEKAGFKKCGTVKVTKYLKRYLLNASL